MRPLHFLCEIINVSILAGAGEDASHTGVIQNFSHDHYIQNKIRTDVSRGPFLIAGLQANQFLQTDFLMDVQGEEL